MIALAAEFNNIDTERRNPRSADFDTLSAYDMAALMNAEDGLCAEAVRAVLPEITQSVDLIAGKLRAGGRLFYCGAGTSGRLGVLDAAECPPTFGTDPGTVVGLIAGGPAALTEAVEGAEDDRAAGEKDLRSHSFSAADVLVGIAAGGRTPYVLGALDYARSVGAPTVALVCCRGSELSRHADITVAPVPGPEVIAGSSRLKSGTCQKMVLNMLSTCVMARLGKVYGNLMVDLRATNEKLRRRAVFIVCDAADTDEAAAVAALEQCGWHCKTAIVMLLLGVDADAARALLTAAQDRIGIALRMHREDGV